jgi:sarcosine oxidase subunit gamma
MVEIIRLADATLITVRCAADTLQQIGEPAGLAFPRTPNRFTTTESTQLLWISPDDTLVIEEASDGRALLAELEQAFAGTHAAVVETSGNRVRLRVSGPGGRELMARACSLDLDPPHFVAGHGAGTMIARAQVFLMQRDDEPTYDILVRRSLADYLKAWLLTAAQAIPS